MIVARIKYGSIKLALANSRIFRKALVFSQFQIAADPNISNILLDLYLSVAIGPLPR